MKRRLIFIMIGLWAFTSIQFPASGNSNSINRFPPALPGKIPALEAQAQFGSLPLYFIPNLGQASKIAAFYAKTSGYTLWLTREGLIFDSIQVTNNLVAEGKDIDGEEKGAQGRNVSRLVFPGANPTPAITPFDMTQHRVNYIKGNNPSQWYTNIQTSKAVLYKNIYPNIDLKVYGIEKQIEYDWIIKPGGKPENIRLHYKNVNGTHIDEAGNLVIETCFGKLIHKRPAAYQEKIEYPVKHSGTGKIARMSVAVKFKMEGENIYGMEVCEYDKQHTLIIDPVVLIYSTYLGGSNKDHNFGLAVDSTGSVYMTGDTYSIDFPTHNGYLNTFAGGGMDAFVTKFSPDGDSLVYSTYLGGGRNDVGECIKVDSLGRAYISGITYSFNFPTYKAYQKTSGGGMDDAFVTVLTASGSGLVASTYLGGNGQDEGFGIGLDGNNNIYIAGRTSSTNFPILNAYKANLGGSLDAFVTKLSLTNGLIYSTYLGGSGEETAYGLAVNSSNVYVAGRTSSINFPTLNEYQGTYGGGDCDAFVTKFSTTGTSLIYSTYLGGNLADTAYDIAVDSSNRPYVTGDTFGSGFPVKDAYQGNHSGNKDVFLTRFTNTGNNIEYSTFLGGGEADSAAHVIVDSPGNAYLVGSTRSSNFPVKRAIQTSFNGSLDVFIAMFSNNGQRLNFSTYLGGGNYDSGRGIAVDSSGNIYASGYTESIDFPTESPYQSSLQGITDTWVCKISLPELGTLCGAVDNCTLSWTTGGNTGWAEQTEMAYYDDDAAQSGPINHSQTSDIQTTVTGPGVLDFRWSVSSESFFDGLSFYIDGTLQNRISGSVTWEPQTYVLPEGEHILKWSYEKDGNSSLGADCGWLDKVDYTPLPEITLSRKQLTFGSFPAGTTGAQTFTIGNKTAGTLKWTLTADQNWITFTPVSGVNSGIVTVSVDPSNLSPGVHSGTITITDAYAANSPQTVAITLNIFQAAGSAGPFGEYATPTDGAAVSGSVPFTGWVLDDIGVQSVKLYRQEDNKLNYIGDALFVEGARPDVETQYPSYPFNYNAGWGYMMLTNFLPNNGNGTFTIVAKARDLEGNEAILGSKTIIVDNAHAVKPFGAIDTPAPGETVSGTIKNQGWVLTPLPNIIPKDGSTINVYIDGVKVGQPAYNFFRPDIAQLFPGYNNSNGAHGYLYLNTTPYANGIHTIVWVAEDDAGNADGIGSRYFKIQNPTTSEIPESIKYNAGDWTVDLEPVEIITGYPKYMGANGLLESRTIYPDKKGMILIEIKELERIELHFNSKVEWSGGMIVGSHFRALPYGSYLDTGKGIFYWQPGPGFVGDYDFIFIKKDLKGTASGKKIRVHIGPKF